MIPVLGTELGPGRSRTLLRAKVSHLIKEETEMIARLWRGVTKAGDAEAYREYLEATGVRTIRGTPGNRGVYVMRTVRDDVAEFLFLSVWDSLESIRAFAGEDVETAVYYPEDERYLLEMTPEVEHWEVVTREIG